MQGADVSIWPHSERVDLCLNEFSNPHAGHPSRVVWGQDSPHWPLLLHPLHLLHHWRARGPLVRQANRAPWTNLAGMHPGGLQLVHDRDFTLAQHKGREQIHFDWAVHAGTGYCSYRDSVSA